MNISNFIVWFINNFLTIGTNILSKIDDIIIYANISLLDFIITIVIINAFIGFLLTIPKGAVKVANKVEKRKK